MKRSTKLIPNILACLMAVSILLSACVPTAPGAAPAAGPITVKDALGGEFSMPAAAQRIVSLAPSNTEILYAIGAEKLLVGREDFSNFPEAALAIPSVGGNMGKYNLEEIVKLQPDLVLATSLTAPEMLKSLQDITPSVFVVQNPKDLEGLYTNLIAIGALTGRQAEAEKLVGDLRARAKAVTDKVAGVSEKPSVFYELDATDPAKPWTAGPGTFIDMLINLAGGKNIGASLQGEYVQISQEELIVQDPQVIFLGDALYGGITAESVAARPGWENISAVKNNLVLPLNDDLVSRPGPRMIDGLEFLAKVLHPELFK